jgi:predicted solute-binding protein
MKSRFSVGCVPYVNARPLVELFDTPNDMVDVTYDVPSKLPILLRDKSVQAILVSSVEYLHNNSLSIVSNTGIFSHGKVASVRLLSKVPIASIKSLALDASSQTSNLLARLILAIDGVYPELNQYKPDVKNMLSNADACVIIGDLGLRANGEGLLDIDLGEAWTNLTGLSFVWALWLSDSLENDESRLLCQYLDKALDSSGFTKLNFDSTQSKASREKLIEITATSAGWSIEETELYLTTNVHYEDSLDGLWEFSRLLKKYNLTEINRIHT